MTRGKLAGYLALSWPPHFAGYVVAPVLVSRLSDRHGWSDGCPGPVNLAGLVLVAAGASFIGWAIVSHYRASPDRVQARATPNYLVTSGAYGRSRNPLYTGGAALWTGWAIVFGSVPIVIGGTLLFGFFAAVGIPFEERMLGRRFGDVYDAYRLRVPRWIRVR